MDVGSEDGGSLHEYRVGADEEAAGDGECGGVRGHG